MTQLPDVIKEIVRPFGEIRQIKRTGFYSDVIITGADFA